MRSSLLEEDGLKVVMEREILQLNAMAIIACGKLWLRLQEDLVEIWSQQGHATYLRGVEALH